MEKLRRWVPVVEAVDRLVHPENYEDTTEPEEPELVERKQEVDERKEQLIELVCEFFRDKTPRVVARLSTFAREGHYEGLPAYVRLEGYSKKEITQEVIMRAWQLHRKKYPRYFPPLDDAPAVKTTSGVITKSVGVRTRTKMWGIPITSIIRWMGTEGWSFAKAKQVVKGLDMDVADATIRAQLGAGKRGSRGEPARLTDDQANHIYSLVK